MTTEKPVLEKPLIVNIVRSNSDDIVTVTDEKGVSVQRTGLTKYVAESRLNGTFADLLVYLTEPAADADNTAYSNSEMKLAASIRQTSLGGESVKLYARVGAHYDHSKGFKLQDRVCDNFQYIVQQRTITIEGTPLEYKNIDLQIAVNHRGGTNSLEKILGN